VALSGLARAFGCAAVRVATRTELLRVLDEVVPSLAGREEPLLIEARVVPDPTFEP
jgi:benzoylformate decarboxylase